MAHKEYLLTPGPTPVPERVLLAMARPLVHHRMASFRATFEEAAAGLKWLFETDGPVLMLAGSGTLAMEAALVNTLRQGERALCVVGGKFGERWRSLCQAYGIEAVSLEVPWGQAVDPERVRAALDADERIGAVLCQANESSTGVRHPVEAIAALTAARPGVLTIVDAVSALGAYSLPMDQAGFDVLLTGSQKALMLPPGQAYLALSDKAWRRAERGDLPRFYCDLRRERRAQAGGETAFTPAISLTVGLVESLRMIKEEGRAECYQRHARLAEATRQGCLALGCRLFAPLAPSPTVTAVRGPTGLDTEALVETLASRYGVAIAGGQDAVKGQIFRVAHLGWFGRFDILTALAAIEMALADLGHATPRGAGVATAGELLR